MEPQVRYLQHRSQNKSINKVNALIGDLDVIRKDCLGETKVEQRPKNPDSFLACKEELTFLLQKLNQDVRDRCELQQKNVNFQKQSQLRMEIHNGLERGQALITQLDTVLSKQKKKGKLSPEELQKRTNAIRDLSALIEDVIKLNGSATMHRDQANRLARDGLINRQAKRGTGSGSRGDVGTGGGGGGGGNNASIPLEPIASSAQEQAWMDDVDQTNELIQSKLELILHGTRQLRDVAENLDLELSVQGKILEEVDTKITTADTKLKIANKQMKHFLKENGGAARWCCIAVLLIVLFALLGASYNMLSAN